MTDKQVMRYDAVRAKISEQMFLKLGIDMARDDRQGVLVIPTDRERFLNEIEQLVKKQVTKALDEVDRVIGKDDDVYDYYSIDMDKFYEIRKRYE